MIAEATSHKGLQKTLVLELVHHTPIENIQSSEISGIDYADMISGLIRSILESIEDGYLRPSRENDQKVYEAIVTALKDRVDALTKSSSEESSFLNHYASTLDLMADELAMEYRFDRNAIRNLKDEFFRLSDVLHRRDYKREKLGVSEKDEAMLLQTENLLSSKGNLKKFEKVCEASRYLLGRFFERKVSIALSKEHEESIRSSESSFITNVISELGMLRNIIKPCELDGSNCKVRPVEQCGLAVKNIFARLEYMKKLFPECD